MQSVVKLDVVLDQLVTNMVKGMKMLQTLTKFWLVPLIFHLFQSSKYSSSINYFCKNLLTLKDSIFLND